MSNEDVPLRLAIAGTGFISAVHVGCALRSSRVRLVAVASARGRARREHVGGQSPDVRLLTLEELFASRDVDAVLVCTRTSDHADHAIAALQGGKHLLLEKPGAVTLEEHQRIAEAAADRPDLVVRVAYHRRHDPWFRELARQVSSGVIGEPFAVQMTSREAPAPGAVAHATGGFIMDVGVHDFDTARWLLGRDPHTAYTYVHSPVGRDVDPDNAYITIGLQDAAATTHLSRTSTIGMNISCDVVGSAGSIRLAAAARADGEITLLSAGRVAPLPADCRARFGDAYQVQIDDFANACQGLPTASASLEDDRWAVATAVAARASAVRREPLAIGPAWDWE